MQFASQSTDILAGLAQAGIFDWKTGGYEREGMQPGAGVNFASGKSVTVKVDCKADLSGNDCQSHLVFVQAGGGSEVEPALLAWFAIVEL